MNLAHPSNPCNGFYGKFLDVKLTSDCNGSCSFCIERGGYCPAPAPVETLVDAANSLEDYQKVLILGGEPFLHPGLIQFLQGIQGKPEIYITTNGSLLDAEMARQTARYLTGINISLHHYDERKNSEIVGVPVSFKELESAIAVYREAGVKVRVNTNLVKGVFFTAHDVFRMQCCAIKLRAEEIRFAELQNAPASYIPASDFFHMLPEDPFKQGCETLVAATPDFRLIVRQACGLVNPCLGMPENPACCGSKTKVLYPNGEITDGWVTMQDEDELDLEAANLPSCHTRHRGDSALSCHGRGCGTRPVRIRGKRMVDTKSINCH